MKRNLIGFIDHKNKRLNYISHINFERLLNDFSDGDKVNITIETYRRKRSLNQNNLLHMYCTLIAEETGESMPRIKEMMKLTYGIKEPMVNSKGEEVVDKDTGEVWMKLKSTADYNTLEMATFIDEIIKWAWGFLGMTLPDPNDLRNNNIKI